MWKDSPHQKKGDTVLLKQKEKKRHLNEENFMSVSDRCEFPILFEAKLVEKFTTVLKQYKHLTIILSLPETQTPRKVHDCFQTV